MRAEIKMTVERTVIYKNTIQGIVEQEGLASIIWREHLPFKISLGQNGFKLSLLI